MSYPLSSSLGALATIDWTWEKVGVNDQCRCARWELAGHLKSSIEVTDGWLAEKLAMGSGAYVSKQVGLAPAVTTASGFAGSKKG